VDIAEKDDRAADRKPRAPQRRREGLREEARRDDLDAVHLGKVGFGDRAERRLAVGRRVVDERIEPLPRSRLREALDRGGVVQIELRDLHAHRVTCRTRCNRGNLRSLLAVRLIGAIGQREIEARAREFDRDRTTHPARCAGDQRPPDRVTFRKRLRRVVRHGVAFRSFACTTPESTAGSRFCLTDPRPSIHAASRLAARAVDHKRCSFPHFPAHSRSRRTSGEASPVGNSP
jgi:hypothetical protein